MRSRKPYMLAFAPRLAQSGSLHSGAHEAAHRDVQCPSRLSVPYHLCLFVPQITADSQSPRHASSERKTSSIFVYVGTR
ncbi:hypothetical protein LX32DRAFT_646081 [Colletotrichum zoysiae]|uniref:Uncharacterized protein n=1 Tax=Colletotrichum zoysiae TaxID=1216348 RepID=A0AAD9H491_9PEZI|nr:hypothetical protein LX32DRAFT_646081 [Colletotrichum zoysiae]